ncbi:MAG TPA: cell division protein ZapA [Nitrococcus sp.]|nr:cell division protein ZapA [Nitrococcus sp.]
MPGPVKVTLLDREYFIACRDDERANLLESVAYLNEQMREIRDSGKIVGMDRIAVMAALNITHEMLEARRNAGKIEDMSERLRRLSRRVADVLGTEEAPRRS